MATKRQTPSSADAVQGSSVKRRLLFSGEDAPETIHVDPESVDETANDDALGGQSGAGVTSVESFDSMAALAAMESGSGTHGQHDAMIREQDRFLPIANVSRIMKRVLPESGKVAKEAKECVQECVSEFISFITSEASERCMHEKRKTINGEDILWAMQTLGFDPYVEPLKVYLSKYRLAVKSDKHPGGANAAAGVSSYSNLVIGDHDFGKAPEGKSSGAGSQAAAAPLYLTQDDLVLGATGDQRQVHLATNADGQLTIIEMRTDADGNVETTDAGATAITLPVLSGSSAGENGAQQYILTTLDQGALGGSGVQQFTIPAGAQLAFIPTSGANGSSGVTTSQGVPVMFLDSAITSNAGGHQQSSQQYITMNASGTGGLQIIHVAPSSLMAGNSAADETGRTGNSHCGTATLGDGH